MTRWIIGMVCLTAVLMVSTAQAQDQRRERRGEGRPERPSREEFLKQFDKDGDGKLSDEERAAAREQFRNRSGEQRGERGPRTEGRERGPRPEGRERGPRGEGRPEGRERGSRGGEGRVERPNREDFLKRFDKDGDGKLSDEERAAAREEFRNRGGEQRGERGPRAEGRERSPRGEGRPEGRRGRGPRGERPAPPRRGNN